MRNKRSLTAAPKLEPKPKKTAQGNSRRNSKPSHGRKMLIGQGKG